jgi:UDP-N-acetylglucosamine--N-acetylmuramyl-(pentapeptide) pyrophosphoryl-undecaprenol N-acetylglucosamine transferase
MKQRKLPWEIVFVGRTHAIEGSRERAVEEDVIIAKKIRFIGLTTGRLQRAFSFYTIISLLKIPVGFVQAYILCVREKPDIIVSFGGYIALPVVIASFLLRIPVLTHEQTRVPGLANRIIAIFARTVCITFPDVLHMFPRKKTIYTGLPVRRDILEPSAKAVFSLPIGEYPLIYITGGTTGSVSLNNSLFPVISDLLEAYTVIHQTGKISFADAGKLRQSMGDARGTRYIIGEYFDESTVGWILQSARYVICRAGANTVMELALLGRKALLVPLPWSGGQEQLENARWLKSLGLGYIIPQNVLDRQQILKGLEYLARSVKTHIASTHGIRKDGAERVVDEIMRLAL